MQIIQGNNRFQSYFSTLEKQVSTDNALRLIDAFVDKLDLEKLGSRKAAEQGNAREENDLGYAYEH